MHASALEAALRRLGEVLGESRDIEILVVGGAAGMLTGLLPPSRVTTDCDVMIYMPEDALTHVELAAEKVAGELGLVPNWLNSNV